MGKQCAWKISLNKNWEQLFLFFYLSTRVYNTFQTRKGLTSFNQIKMAQQQLPQVTPYSTRVEWRAPELTSYNHFI